MKISPAAQAVNLCVNVNKKTCHSQTVGQLIIDYGDTM